MWKSLKIQLNFMNIICCNTKNPPTLHSSSKIQPTTSPTFVFSVSACLRKKWGYERKLLIVGLGRSSSSSCFLFSFYYFYSKVLPPVNSTSMFGRFKFQLLLTNYIVCSNKNSLAVSHDYRDR
jgi:hypothetical protein